MCTSSHGLLKHCATMNRCMYLSNQTRKTVWETLCFWRLDCNRSRTLEKCWLHNVTLHTCWVVKLFLMIHLKKHISNWWLYQTYLPEDTTIHNSIQKNHSRKYQVPQWCDSCWIFKFTWKLQALADTLHWASISDMLSSTAMLRNCNKQIVSLLYILHNTVNVNTYLISHVCLYVCFKRKNNGHTVMTADTRELKKNLSHQFNMCLDWTFLMSTEKKITPYTSAI
jgi:hypothetical protein